MHRYENENQAFKNPSEVVQKIADILSKKCYSQAFFIEIEIMRFLFDNDLTIVKREK